MAFDRKTLLATTFIAGLAIFAPSFAMAQSQTPQTPPAEEEEDEADQATANVGDVVVTGSRIRRNEYTSTQPIEVITAEESTLEGLVDPSQILQGSTAAGTANQINNNFTGFVTTGGPGVNTLSVRGLGAQRTLILLNGRRLGPAGARGTVGPVDLNVIPSALVERYELLLDGASSIYGSDALAGVVNIITDTNIDGGSIGAFVSRPFEDGGATYQLSGNFGRVFDRGYATIGAEFFEREELLYGDRDDLACTQSFVFADEALTIRRDVVDPTTGDYKCQVPLNNMIRNFNVGFGAGPVRTGDYQYSPTAVYGGGFTGCDVDGWQQFAGGSGACSITAAGTAVRRAGNAAYNPSQDKYLNSTAVSPVKRYSVSAFAGYDLTPNIELFGEFLFNRRESSQTSDRQIFPNVSPFHTESPFGGPCNFMADPGGPTDCLVSLPVIAVNYTNEQEIDYMRGVVGLRGDVNLFSREWSWELAGQYSRSDATYTSDQFYNDRVEATAGYEALFDGRAFGDGVLAGYPAGDGDNCDEALLTTATDCPTGGVNWFDPTLLATGSAPNFDSFLQFVSVGETKYTQKYIEGVISGELFDLPAGSVAAALGFHVREEEIDDIPDEQEQAGNLWGFSAAGHTVGSDTVRELFAEVEIPVLANMPMFDELTVNVSGRMSDYDSYGENSTYKVGLNWQITPQFRIRASEGTSFRAPALYELFLADQTSFTGQLNIDPCINYQDSTNALLQQNCAADGVPVGYTGFGSSALVTTGGGLGNLEGETGQNTTVGVIFTPTNIDFSLAVDYFETTINDQIDQIGSGNILFQCYTSQNYPTDPLCNLFTRDQDPASTSYLNILTVNDNYVNISEQRQKGLDFSLRYSRDFSFGDLTFTSRVSHILDHTQQTFPDSVPDVINDQTGNPETVGNTQIRFDRGDWTVFYDMDWASAASDNRFFANGNATTFFGEPVFAQYSVDPYFLHSMTVRRQMNDFTFVVGIRNIFDENAPQVTNGFLANGAFGSQYDYFGRQLILSLSKDF